MAIETNQNNRTTDAASNVEDVRSAFTNLPQAAQAAIIESTVNLLPPIDVCGLILTPTQLETDIKTIMSRVRITSTLSGFSGSVINVGDTFQLNVKVRNCTGHDLNNVQLIASSTSFASVTSAGTVSLGKLLNAAPDASATFQCKGSAATPTTSDTLINLTLFANPDLRGVDSSTVKGQVALS